MNEIAKFSNELNKLPLRGMNLNQKKVFMTLLWAVKETDGTEINIEYEKFMSLTQAKPKSFDAGVRLIQETFRKILSLSIAEIETDSSYEEFVFFISRKIDKDTGMITVQVNPYYAHYIKDFAKAFTSYPLEIGNSFKSEYTIDVYKFFRQYSDTGFWAVTIEDFRKYLAIPESYGMTRIRSRIVDPALAELADFYPELSYVEIYEKKKRGQRGRKKVQSLRFHFTKEEHNKWVEGKYDEVEKSKSKTNVPSWSNPDYKNTTTPEQIAEMEREAKKIFAQIDQPINEK